MNYHSVHPKQVMSQTRIPTHNHHPADQKVAHPQGEGEKEGDEVEKGGGKREGGEERSESDSWSLGLGRRKDGSSSISLS